MQSVGERLRSAREAKGVTASEAAAATKIKVQHIEALEAEDFNKIAAPIYVKGFLKLYAEYLSLEADSLIEQYKEGHAPLSPSQIVGSGESREKGASKFRFLGSSKGREEAAEVDTAPGKALPSADMKERIDKLRQALGKVNLPPGILKHAAILTGAIVVLVLLLSTISNCARRSGENKSRRQQEDISLIEGIPEPYIEPENMPRK